MSVTLNSRSRSILSRLLESENPLPVSEIADGLKVTARMVRYQLEDIEHWLEPRGARLERRPGRGIWIEYRGATNAQLTAELLGPGHYENKLSEGERLRLMRLTFLAEARAQTSQKLGDYLGVSKTTVAKDLKHVRDWFLERGLFLKGTPGVGLNLVGDEMSWRRAMADAIKEGGTEPDFVRAFHDTDDAPAGSFMASTLQSLHDVDLKAVTGVIKAAEDMLGISFTDMSRASLLIHIGIAVKRLRVGREVHLSKAHMELLRHKREHRFALEMAASLEKSMGIRVPESEVCYLTMHILSARTMDDAGADRFESDPELPGFDPRDVARKIALAAENLLGRRIADHQLISGLTTHLTPIFYRLKFGLPVRNPLLDEIKRKHAKVYEVATRAAEQFLLTAGMILPEEEIGFIAMHLGAALERSREQQARPRVYVVCASGISSASMLASRLRSEFPELEVLKTLSVAELQQTQEPADMIISTIPIEMSDTPAVVVNPLLTDEDMDRIRAASFSNKILRRERASRRHRARQAGGRRERAGFGRFAELLGEPGSIKLDVQADDWRQAIEACGRLLVNRGICAERYISAMISVVEKHGPYIVVAPGIAVPHAASDNGALALGASLVKLRTPVAFGHPHNDPVSVVIATVIPDKRVVADFMEDLTLALLSQPVRDALRRAKTPEDVLMALREGGDE